MALGDLWSRTLVYFGIAEEDDDWEDDLQRLGRPLLVFELAGPLDVDAFR